jgi:hypothetical protein
VPGVDVTGGAVTGVKDDRRSHDEVAGPPHGDMVAQPHSEDEGPVAEAEQLAAKLSGLGRKFVGGYIQAVGSPR